MSKTAVQKDRLPFQFEGAASCDVLWGEGGLGLPKPKPNYVPGAEAGERISAKNSLQNFSESQIWGSCRSVCVSQPDA